MAFGGPSSGTVVEEGATAAARDPAAPRLRPGPHGQVRFGKPVWLVVEGTGCRRSSRGPARSSLASLGTSETSRDTRQQDTVVQFAEGTFGGMGIRTSPAG